MRTVPPAAFPPAAARLRRGVMTDALHAEWVKLRTVPGPAVTLLLTAVLTIAAGAVAAAISDHAPDPVRLSLIGVHLAHVLVAAAGVYMVAGEPLQAT
ncbi:MAG: hypothetical protein ABW022_08855, partial [Actinoplanes sp.]